MFYRKNTVILHLLSELLRSKTLTVKRNSKKK